MPRVILEHDGCEPWVSEHDTDDQADAFTAAWPGWSRAEQAPAAPEAAPETPAEAPVDVPAPAGPTALEGV